MTALVHSAAEYIDTAAFLCTVVPDSATCHIEGCMIGTIVAVSVDGNRTAAFIYIIGIF